MRKHITLQVVTFCTLFLLSLTFLPSNGVAADLNPAIQTALDKADTTLAIDLLNKEIELDPYYLNFYTLGRIFYERGQYEKAIGEFEKALDKKSKDLDSKYFLGLAYLKINKIEDAEKVLTEGLKKAKKDEKHRFENGIGLVELRKGIDIKEADLIKAKEFFGEADRHFRQALVDEPNNAEYHINLGDANFYNDVAPLAVLEYEKALELDTAGLEVYYHWAEACLELKDYNCAIEKLKVVLQKDSTHAPAWMRAAGIYFKAARSSRSRADRTNRFKETIGAYKKYLELSNAPCDSQHVRVYFELATSYSELNGFEDAADYYDKVLAIPMEPRDIYFYYGKALWGSKQYVKATDMLLKHIDWVAQQDDDYRSTIRDYELYQLIGDGYYYRKDKDFYKAIDNYKKSLADRPDQKRLVQNVATAYYFLKSYKQALDYYNKRIEMGIDEKYASVYKYAGYCAMYIANNTSADDGDEMLDEELDDEPAVVDTTNYYEVCAKNFEEYLKFDSTDVKILTALASTKLFQLSQCTEGVKYFEKILEIEPDNCDAKKSLGYAYFGGICTINYSKALNYLLAADKCIKATGENSGLDLSLLIAKAYHLRAADKLAKKQDANDDFKSAYNWYGTVLKYDANNPEAKKGQDDVRFEFVE